MMYPIETYRISPNLFGVTRWQAEVDGQPLRFARRGYTPAAAAAKLAADLNAHYEGRSSIMQSVVLPVSGPVRQAHDRVARAIERRKRAIINGRLELGRVWLVWRGWRRPSSYRIGSTRVFSVGPLAVFVQAKRSA